MNKPLLAFLLLLITLIGCKKTERSVSYFPDELKPYALFGMGSYWIYKNDIIGKEDSTYLLSPPVLSFVYIGETGPKEEWLFSHYGGNFLTSVPGRPDSEDSGYVLCHSFKGASGSISIISGNIYKGYYRHSTYSNYSFEVLSTSDTLRIDSNIYVNVLVTQYVSFPFQNHDSVKCTYFFDKSHGLIKYTYHTNGQDSTWNLVRSHVVR